MAADVSDTCLSEETCLVVSSVCRQESRGNGGRAKKEDQQARYWSYLFDNLHRVIDEIFCTCEADKSIIECEEVMMTLEVCRKDFEKLIKKIEVEYTSHTDTRNRPPSILPESHSSAFRSACSSRLSDADATTSSLSPHVRLLEFSQSVSVLRGLESTEGSPSLKRSQKVTLKEDDIALDKEDGSLSDSTCRDGDESVRDSSRREPTPVSALFSGTGFELASKVVEKGGPVKSEVQSVLPPPSSSPSGGSLRSVPVVHKSQAGKLQVYVDIPDNAPPNYVNYLYRQRDPSRAVPYSKIIDRIEAENPPEEGWEVVQSRYRRGFLERRHHSRVEEDGENEEEAAFAETDREGDGRESCVQDVGDDFLSVSSAASELQIHIDAADESFGSALTDSNVLSRSYVEVLKRSSGEGDGRRGTDRLASSDGALDLFHLARNSEKRLSVLSEDLGALPLLSPETKSPAKMGHLHQKLSSPQRRKLVDSEESRRQLEDRLLKAQHQRDKIHEGRAQRLRGVSYKVEGIRLSRDEELEKRRVVMEEKLEKAKMLRDCHLQEIVRKAKEEDLKKNEIAFISNLEAQNKKMQVMERLLGNEARLLDIQEERQKKKEEQQAKEEAALERRRTLEVERIARLQEIHHRRQEQDAKREMWKVERDKAREEAAQEKAKERERKLVARQTATVQLERRIQLKYDESAKRHDLQLEQIREKAALVSRHGSSEDALGVVPYERRRWCHMCQVMIISELYLMTHLRSKRHQEATSVLSEEEASLCIVFAESQEGGEPADRKSHYDDIVERVRKNKKRIRKLRTRMSQRADALKASQPSVTSASSMPKTKHKQHQQQPKLSSSCHKLIRELKQHIDVYAGPRCHGNHLNSLDKSLGDIVRFLASSKNEADRNGLLTLDIMSLLSELLRKIIAGEEKAMLPFKCISLVAAVVKALCQGCHDNCVTYITGNHIQWLLDITSILYQNLLEEVSSLKSELQDRIISHPNLSPLTSLLAVLASLYSTLAQGRPGEGSGGGTGGGADDLEKAVCDSISYAVGRGVFDCMQASFNPVCGPLDNVRLAEFLVSSVNLLIAVSAHLQLKVKNVFAPKPLEDTTLFVDVLQRTELFGVPTLLYAILLHEGPLRHSSVPPTLPKHTIAIATAAVKLINNASLMNFRVAQESLGDDSTSVSFRIVTSYLIWHCSHHRNDVLLHELIMAVGYFCALNPHNQSLLTVGSSPTLIQLLCTLPFEYFSSPKLSVLLFPTLICACYHNADNKAILQQEISFTLIHSFIKEQMITESSSEKCDKSPALDMACFANRFPRSQWGNALKYFGVPTS